MTLFYDPRKRKVRLWVLSVFIVLPVFLLIIGWLATKKNVEEYKILQLKEMEEDIFDKF